MNKEVVLNTQWKPKGWITILIGILLQPFVFLYVNRPKLFWLYLIAEIAVRVIEHLFLQNPAEGGWYSSFYLRYIFVLVCPAHAYFIAKNYDVTSVRRWYSRWWGLSGIYAAILVPVVLFRTFLFEPFTIPASSMSPTLNVGDLIVVKKWGFGDYETIGVPIVDTALAEKAIVKRGGIYVFYPPNSAVPFVKRLIGLPGDTVRIEGNEISVNGETFSASLVSDSPTLRLYRESYQDNNYLIQQMPMRPFSVKQKITVPEDQFFFLGDNRDNSADSRVWGTVPGTSFVGEVVFVLGGPNS